MINEQLQKPSGADVLSSFFFLLSITIDSEKKKKKRGGVAEQSERWTFKSKARVQDLSCPLNLFLVVQILGYPCNIQLFRERWSEKCARDNPER